jgi:hypothetical protein
METDIPSSSGSNIVRSMLLENKASCSLTGARCVAPCSRRIKYLNVSINDILPNAMWIPRELRRNSAKVINLPQDVGGLEGRRQSTLEVKP